MKNLTSAIISIALLWGLSGCLYTGDYPASSLYYNGSPYPYQYSGVDYYGYPWFQPFGYYSYGHSHDYRHQHLDSHRRNLHRNYGRHHDYNRHMKQNKQPHHERQISRYKQRNREQNHGPAATVNRSTAHRQQTQKGVNRRALNNHSQRKEVVHSERRASGNWGKKKSERKVICSGRQC